MQNHLTPEEHQAVLDNARDRVEKMARLAVHMPRPDNPAWDEYVARMYECADLLKLQLAVI